MAEFNIRSGVSGLHLKCRWTPGCLRGLGRGAVQTNPAGISTLNGKSLESFGQRDFEWAAAPGFNLEPSSRDQNASIVGLTTRRQPGSSIPDTIIKRPLFLTDHQVYRGKEKKKKKKKIKNLFQWFRSQSRVTSSSERFARSEVRYAYFFRSRRKHIQGVPHEANPV